ncbi:unnamed protein product [Prunus brigantina]
MEADRPPQFDETVGQDEKKEVDDPPGEGPILSINSVGSENWPESGTIQGKMSLQLLVRGLNTEKKLKRIALGLFFPSLRRLGKLTNWPRMLEFPLCLLEIKTNRKPSLEAVEKMREGIWPNTLLTTSLNYPKNSF